MKAEAETVTKTDQPLDQRTRKHLLCHLIVTAVLFVFLFHRVLWRFWVELNRGDEPWLIVFVPILSVIVLRQRLSEMPRYNFERGSRLGIVVIVVGMLLHLLGIAVQSFPPSQVAMVTMLQGLVLYACGKQIYRFLFFPLAYLYLAIPPPPSFSILVTGPLKTLSASLASKSLNAVGVAVVRTGTLLSFPIGTLSIADECSGLMSVLTLSIMSLPLGYLTQNSFARKAVIFAASIPLAFAANVLRVVVTALLFKEFGRLFSECFAHVAIGMAIVFAAFFTLYGLGLLISDRRGGGETMRGPMDIGQLQG